MGTLLRCRLKDSNIAKLQVAKQGNCLVASWKKDILLSCNWKDREIVKLKFEK